MGAVKKVRLGQLLNFFNSHLLASGTADVVSFVILKENIRTDSKSEQLLRLNFDLLLLIDLSSSYFLMIYVHAK